MFIAGNWKLNCNILQGNKLASTILKNIEGKNLNCNIAIFPPFTCLSSISDVLKDSVISLGGQDCSIHTNGAFTGDISASMLVDVGCKYVILGHSERRMGYKESNELIKTKANVAQNMGLVPIVCVGETAKERNLGKEKSVVKTQLLNSIPNNSKGSYIIAYEPVWAIGSGITPNIDEIKEMFVNIKYILKSSRKNDDIKILYGGSVNINNSLEILSCDEVNGALIGGTSLNADEFSSICLDVK